MDVLLDEVESLEAILMEDVRITRNETTGLPTLIETTVLPTVGADGTDTQYVCVTLQVCPTAGYPDAQPAFALRNPRGLDDRSLEAIRRACQQKLQDSIGLPVVFDLIEVVREHLTESNLPSGQCVVCLYGFREGDAFTKTACYHYLHSYCLARHLAAAQRNHQDEMAKLPVWQQRQMAKPFRATCPVCREGIDDAVEPLRAAAAPADLASAPRFEVTEELRALQASMASLFQRQRCRGGIIEQGETEANVIAIEDEMERRRREQGGMGNGGQGGANEQEVGGVGGGSGAGQRMSAHQRVTCRNHKQIAPPVVTPKPKKQAAAAATEEASGDEDEDEQNGGGGGRHRRHHDHHRRGGNRHNRRRQYHTSHSSGAGDAPPSSSSSSSSNGTAAAAAASATATR